MHEGMQHCDSILSESEIWICKIWDCTVWLFLAILHQIQEMIFLLVRFQISGLPGTITSPSFRARKIPSFSGLLECSSKPKPSLERAGFPAVSRLHQGMTNRNRKGKLHSPFSHISNITKPNPSRSSLKPARPEHRQKTSGRFSLSHRQCFCFAFPTEHIGFQCKL